MSEMLLSVSEHLLGPGGLSIEQLPGVLGDLAGPGIDAADLYFQSQVSETWVLEDGIVKEGSFHLDQGVGVRAQSGEKTGFAYSNAITADALAQAAQAARSIARAGQNGRVQAFDSPVVTALYGRDNPLDVIGRAEKVDLLKQVDQATRALDPRIKQVTVSLAGVWDRILVAAVDGSLAADIRPLVRFNVSVIVEQNGRRERGGQGGDRGRRRTRNFRPPRLAQPWPHFRSRAGGRHRLFRHAAAWRSRRCGHGARLPLFRPPWPVPGRRCRARHRAFEGGRPAA